MRTAIQTIQILLMGTNITPTMFDGDAYATQAALKQRGIDTMVEEARENDKESDAEYLRR